MGQAEIIARGVVQDSTISLHTKARSHNTTNAPGQHTADNQHHAAAVAFVNEYGANPDF